MSDAPDQSIPLRPPAPAPTAPARSPLLDPGWLFLVAGVSLLAATVLIPAQNDLNEANFYLRRAQMAEEHRLARIGNYAAYLQKVENPDEDTIVSLAATQLNKAPQGMTLLKAATEPAKRSSDVFSDLEPEPLVLPEKPEHEMSRLERWATEDASRLWLIAAGAMCVLIGLLPPTRDGA